MHKANCPEEPGAGILPAGICEGGAGQPASLPRQLRRLQPVVESRAKAPLLRQKKNIEELLAICAKLDDRAAVR